MTKAVKKLFRVRGWKMGSRLEQALAGVGRGEGESLSLLTPMQPWGLGRQMI
jgi:hypothetical protein